MLKVSCKVKVVIRINLQSLHTELMNKNPVESNFEIKFSENALSTKIVFWNSNKTVRKTYLMQAPEKVNIKNYLRV
jgi:hypothetical protein